MISPLRLVTIDQPKYPNITYNAMFTISRTQLNGMPAVSVLSKNAITRPTISPTTPKKISTSAMSASIASVSWIKAENTVIRLGEKMKEIMPQTSPAAMKITGITQGISLSYMLIMPRETKIRLIASTSPMPITTPSSVANPRAIFLAK